MGSETITETIYNKYSRLNINLGLGHELLRKGSFSLAAAGGIIWNIKSKANGLVLNPENLEDTSITYRSESL